MAGVEIGEQFGQQIRPAAAVPQMMMGIDDRQLRFEDRLLLLFCQPRIVRLAAMTKPAWLNGLRHGMFLFLPTSPGFPGSVMAILSLMTSAAKLSLVTAECMPREAMPAGGQTGQLRR